MMPVSSSRQWLRRSLGIAMVIASALYLVPTRMADQAVRGGRPDLALAFDPSSSNAAALMAERALNARKFDQAKVFADQALRSDPLDLRALRVAALIADRNNDGSAAALFKLAGRLSWRDTQTQLWLLADAAVNRDYSRMMDHADALYRRDKRQLEVLNVLAQSIADPKSHAAIADKFETNPALRHAVLWRIGDSDKALHQYAFPFLAYLATRERPANAQELGPFMRSLVASGNEQAAFTLWRTRPGVARDVAARRGGLLYDGGLTAGTGPGQPAAPFQWATRDDSRAEAYWNNPDFDGAGRGLLVQTDQGVPIDVAEQTLMLGPGRYRLSGRVQHDDNGAPRIRITCLRNGASVADIEDVLKGSGAVRPFSISFAVPAGCLPQRIVIGNGLSGSGVAAASFWLGNLDLRRE